MVERGSWGSLKAERWQILSPTRSRAFGTTEINRHIKRTYRGSELALAQRNNSTGTNIPGPYRPGADRAWGQGYGDQERLQLNVEYSSQPGAQYSYWASGSEDAKLELAWAVTVHKSQGSEFAVTFLVLPARTTLSRELTYTALTRQRNRVVILHEGTLADLQELSHPWRSDTARRLTDLFAAPRPVLVDPGNSGRPQRLDGRVMHVTAVGVVLKSKERGDRGDRPGRDRAGPVGIRDAGKGRRRPDTETRLHDPTTRRVARPVGTFGAYGRP